MKIDSDEVYPFFYISDSPVYDWEKYGEVVFTPEEKEYHLKAERDYRDWQDFLSNKRDEARKVNK